MSAFQKHELTFLQSGRRLARIATVGRDGTPHVVRVGWSYDRDTDTIDVGGQDFANTKKYRDVARTGRAAIVIDVVLTLEPAGHRGPRSRRGHPRPAGVDPNPPRNRSHLGTRGVTARDAPRPLDGDQY